MAKISKQCSRCGKVKSLSEFYKRKNTKDGYRCWCKECGREYAKKYREEHKEHGKQYREKNKDYYKQYTKKYYQEHKEEIKERAKNWYKKYPWYRSYHAAEQRCNNPKSISYKRYGGKGVEMLMSVDDFKYLWFRDKAYSMERPSIDRRDSNGDYELDNCRFLELIENSGRTATKKEV